MRDHAEPGTTTTTAGQADRVDRPDRTSLAEEVVPVSHWRGGLRVPRLRAQSGGYNRGITQFVVLVDS